LALSIRKSFLYMQMSELDGLPGLAMELLLERYELPRPTDPKSLLALHEAGLLSKYREVIRAAVHHRNQEVNNYVLPHCQRIVNAIGNRMAYEAAKAAGVSSCLVDLYLSSVIQSESAWYVENLELGTTRQEKLQADALNAVLLQVEKFIQGLNVEDYLKSVPIISDARWNSFVQGLEAFDGNGKIQSEHAPREELAKL
jgi:acyl-CoA oxidase